MSFTDKIKEIKNSAKKYFLESLINDMVYQIFNDICDEDDLNSELIERYREIGVIYSSKKNGNQKIVALNDVTVLIEDTIVIYDTNPDSVDEKKIKTLGIGIKYQKDGESGVKLMKSSDFYKKISYEELEEFYKIIKPVQEKISDLKYEIVKSREKEQLDKQEEENNLIRSVFKQ